MEKLGVMRILQFSQHNGKLPLPRWKQGIYPVIRINASYWACVRIHSIIRGGKKGISAYLRILAIFFNLETQVSECITILNNNGVEEGKGDIFGRHLYHSLEKINNMGRCVVHKKSETTTALLLTLSMSNITGRIH